MMESCWWAVKLEEKPKYVVSSTRKTFPWTNSHNIAAHGPTLYWSGLPSTRRRRLAARPTRAWLTTGCSAVGIE